MPDPMVRGGTRCQDRRMTALMPRMDDPARHDDQRDPTLTGGRDPAHELYEHAAGLLASAQALEAATHARGAVAAVSPTLACVETSLASLAEAVERLRGQALTRLSEPVWPNEDRRRQRAEVALQFERLAGVLGQAAQISANARGALEPVSAELTVF
jgi:hypothetical protein